LDWSGGHSEGGGITDMPYLAAATTTWQMKRGKTLPWPRRGRTTGSQPSITCSSEKGNSTSRRPTPSTPGEKQVEVGGKDVTSWYAKNDNRSVLPPLGRAKRGGWEASKRDPPQATQGGKVQHQRREGSPKGKEKKWGSIEKRQEQNVEGLKEV